MKIYNDNIFSENLTSEVWGGKNARRPYHYLIGIERLFPKDHHLKKSPQK